jgi:hypothetical protein
MRAEKLSRILVMRGLDPRIHAAVPSMWRFRMDRRVKPGGDEKGNMARIERSEIDWFLAG